MTTPKTPHTPTPWAPGLRHADTIDIRSITTGAERIATVHPGTHQSANLALIVQAVNVHQDLLDALEAILFQVSQGKILLERDACVRQARAALAKARGVQP